MTCGPDNVGLAPAKTRLTWKTAPRTVNLQLLVRNLDKVAEFCVAGRGEEAVRLLRHLVPEYPCKSEEDRAFR